MNIQDIKRIGYFDNIKLYGNIEPMYRSNGIGLYPGLSLEESMDLCNKPESYSVYKVHIDLIGEINSSTDKDIIDRLSLELKINLNKNGTTYKGLIGYVDILVIKGENLISNLDNNGRNEESLTKLANNTDEIELFISSLRMCDYLLHGDNYNIAIVDRVYIHKSFRRLGISSWIHNNIFELVKWFGIIKPDIIILEFGDFSNEAIGEFKLTKNGYNNMLRSMYFKLGYKKLSLIQRNIMGIYNPNILYKLAD